jgi:CRISPR-associated endonuclease/helicase Cas3
MRMTTHHEDRDFRRFFCDAMGFEGPDAGPYDWQVRIAVDGLPDVLPIPTGLGKTEGAVLGWAWRRPCAELGEPLHLVYCLPMRALVHQTVKRLNRCFDALASKRNIPRVPVYQLMGGLIDEEWASCPDRPWVLVGTQDQLLSRALNRGYAMSRFQWPMHFGLLNQDCRWIVDEIQLMGPGLWTTSQLDWMRQKRFPGLKPCRTTWMSATVGQAFLATTDRKNDGLDQLDKDKVFDPRLEGDQNPELQRRLSARRSVEWFKASARTRAPTFREQIALRVSAEHREGTLSLVICNTVRAAQDVLKALPDRVPKVLLTSRFRAIDRRDSEQKLLAFEARRSKSGSARLVGDAGLVCVSTQVVEAGIDISAHRLWSELAPWPSIIQRVGRLNRDGRDNESDDPARAYFWKEPKGEEGPYSKRDLGSAETLIDAIVPLSVEMPFAEAIKRLGERHGKLLESTLQPEPAPLPRAIDVHGLFSTERDLHGGFTDVSGFVRNADADADLTVFWRVWPGPRPPRGEALDGPALDLHSEGCPVAFQQLRKMLERQRAKAWIWNDEEERWEVCALGDLRPGMVVMLHRNVGGYATDVGWTGNPSDALPGVPEAGDARALVDDEPTEVGAYVALDVHLKDARAEAERMCEALGLSGDVRRAVVEAAALHDIGKAHPKWQSQLPAGFALQGGPWAKCPRVLAIDVPSADPVYCQEVTRLRANALALPAIPNRRSGVRLRWIVDRKLNRKELEQLSGMPCVRWVGHVPFRPGMRHEAASALAMWAHYREDRASYPALAVYLAAAHHGKVRTVLRSTMPNGADVFGISSQPDSLVVEGECWPLDFTVVGDGAAGEWTGSGFVVTDFGWTGLVADLLGPWRSLDEDRCSVGIVPDGEPRRLGPFALAWLEALVRVADWRASANPARKVTLPE